MKHMNTWIRLLTDGSITITALNSSVISNNFIIILLLN